MKLPLTLLAAAAILTSSAFAAELKVGDAAPVITGTTDTAKPLDLGQVYKNQKYTLVYFYPKAYTGGCTAQGCSLRDGYEALTKLGVAIVGVSVDSVADQRGFKELNHFQFPLISDMDHKVMEAFGMAANRTTAQRSAYLVKDGKIVYADYKGTTDKQAETILAVVADLEKK